MHRCLIPRRRPGSAAASRVLLWLAVLALPPAHAAGASAAPFIEELTSTELTARVQAGATTALVPIGGTEQHGSHMALGKHNARVRVLAGRIAAALGNALVAPVIAYVPEGAVSPATGHMRYAGTMTIPEAAFEQVLDSTARSLRASGFRNIVFLGDHGGYQDIERRVAERLSRAWLRDGVHVVAPAAYYRAATTEFAQVLRARGFTGREIGVHGGIGDTALTLALVPDMVRTDRLAAASGVAGVTGDPTRATADLGQIGVDLIVTRTVAAIRESARR